MPAKQEEVLYQHPLSVPAGVRPHACAQSHTNSPVSWHFTTGVRLNGPYTRISTAGTVQYRLSEPHGLPHYQLYSLDTYSIATVRSLRFTMASSLFTILTFSIALSVLLQEGAGLPVSQSGEVQSAGPSATHRVRTKRCSCSNWLDKECIYFCHLDIIWVNTPSKTTPYGLGSPLSRRRRSTGRCECHSPNDHTCHSFCHNSSENPALVIVNPQGQRSKSMGSHDNDLLTFLRQVVSANQKAAELQSASPRKKGLRTSWPMAR
ncbi:hypothetical protein ACEWY4_024358 [Coilia grayii]|uniref:Endothelin-like toxin domain-containing protein n=1 Tax=Coilia grayii TaxID=363190 RepID=A0ABD1J2R4_9TELE